MDFALAGYRREPDELAEKHWSFDQIRPKIPSVGSGSFDLRQFSPSSTRHNQCFTNACVGNAISKAAEIKRVEEYGFSAHVDLSRMANYYLARELMSPQETDRDEGTYVSMGAEALRRFGVCTEAEWPFDEAKLFTPPSWKAMRSAYVHKISAWYKITTKAQGRVEDIITNLTVGNPTVFGVRVSQDWRNYKKGVLDVPNPSTPILGGHAVVIVGWLEDYLGGVFIIESSWGNNWGEDGFAYVSPDLIERADFSSDFVVMCGGFEEWAK